MFVVVVLLLVLRQAIHQVVRGLVGDVRQEPVHYWQVAVKLILDGVSEIWRMLYWFSFLLDTYTG